MIVAGRAPWLRGQLRTERFCRNFRILSVREEADGVDAHCAVRDQTGGSGRGEGKMRIIAGVWRRGACDLLT